MSKGAAGNKVAMRQRQETFLDALRRTASPSTAARIAGVKYSTVGRWRSRDPEFHADMEFILDELEDAGRYRRLRKAPPAFVILKLRSWLGVSNAKIAEVFEVSEAAIVRRIDREIE